MLSNIYASNQLLLLFLLFNLKQNDKQWPLRKELKIKSTKSEVISVLSKDVGESMISPTCRVAV